MANLDRNCIGTTNVGVVRHAHFITTSVGKVWNKGSALLPFQFLHVMDIAFANERRGMDAVLPLANKNGLRIVDNDSREHNWIRHDVL